MNTVTLLAATRTDISLAGVVEGALRARCACRVRVVQPEDLVRAERWDAVVTSAGVEALRPLFASLRCARRATPCDSPVLIHPSPTADHYKLALRCGIGDVIAWPDEFACWQPQEGGLGVSRDVLDGLALPETLRRRIARVAAFRSNVLVLGETGSGKEHVARAIHELSDRRGKPLVVVNCAALPEHLVESELFGHERGAFTGAHASHTGKLGLAQGGTLFLDEVGDMPRAAQAKVLRMIEGHEYFRVGGSHAIASDVRLVAATHQDLEGMCERGEFRHDLYFRLNVARIEVPALRERAGCVLALADRFLRESCRTVRRPPPKLSAPVRRVLEAYDWPGNVRELRNAMEAAVIDADGDSIELADLPGQIVRWAESAARPPDERAQLVSALQRTHWNKASAARELRWSRMKLYRKLHLYHLDAAARDTTSQPL